MSINRTNSDAENLQLAFGFHQSGQLHRAEPLYRHVIARQPGNFNALFLLGMLHAQQGRLETAAQLFGSAARIKPDFVDAHYNHGAAHNALGLHGAAIDSYDNVLRLKPDHIDALRNRATSCFELRRFQEALCGYDRVLEISGDHAEALDNRGVVLRELERFEEALASHDRALEIEPHNAGALSNRGIALRAQRRFEEALQSYDRAIRLKPDFVEAHFNRGVALSALKRFEEALQACDRTIRIKPDYAEAYSNRGTVLAELKRFEEALHSYDRAIRLKPDIDFLRGDILHTKMKICDWSNYDGSVADLCGRTARDEKVAAPFILLSQPSSLALQRRSSETWIKARYPASDALQEISRPPPHRKIRLGYFSADFRIHPIALSTAELFERHDRSKFELIAFSFGPDTGDELRRRLEPAFDKFIDVRHMPDRDVALLARSLEIDIGVDLNGFTEDARTNIFAMRAAPVQVSYLGYPGTLGADYVDYLIADPLVIPASSLSHYREKIAYLPNSYHPNNRTRRISDRQFTRSELGLPNDGFVFCCFNRNHKITPAVFDSWMRILRHVEASVLWLSADTEVAAENLRKEAVARGVDPVRLVFAARVAALPDHLARHRMADLFLDTLPYNAHATANDALWTGLPVLTQIGETFAGRVAASLLHAIHLPELVTTSRDAYEALAVEIATNRAKLAAIRQKLADNRLTTPLFDTAMFANHIESAYAKMYERYRADLPPDHIYVAQ